LYIWIKDEGLEAAIQEGRNRILDLAENKLASKIKEGDTTSLIFFLKTQGKARGYVEKTETVNQNTNVNTNIEVSTEEAKAIKKALDDKY